MVRSQERQHELGSTLWPAFALSLSVAVGNGVGRFAYALLLPAMQQDLALSYAQSGWLNTANALGYILGAVSSYLALSQLSARQIFIAGLVLCSLCIGLTGLSSDLGWLSTLRLITGLGAAWMFSCGTVLVQQIYASSCTQLGVATGLYFGGAGLGIAIPGLVIPPMLGQQGVESWPQAWMVLGVLAALGGIWPLRVALANLPAAAGDRDRGALKVAKRGLVPSLLAYTLFAMGYVGYMTFIFAWLRQADESDALGSLTWTVLGLCVCLSPFIWRKPLARWPGEWTLSASCGVTLAGVLLVMVADPVATALPSAALFGLGMFIAPASVAVVLRERLPAAAVARGLALFTTAFALGQAVGPLLAGSLADRYGLSATLWPGVVLLGLAAVLASLSRLRR